jgi:hypothetical protein
VRRLAVDKDDEHDGDKHETGDDEVASSTDCTEDRWGGECNDANLNKLGKAGKRKGRTSSISHDSLLHVHSGEWAPDT